SPPNLSTAQHDALPIFRPHVGRARGGRRARPLSRTRARRAGAGAHLRPRAPARARPASERAGGSVAPGAAHPRGTGEPRTGGTVTTTSVPPTTTSGEPAPIDHQTRTDLPPGDHRPDGAAPPASALDTAHAQLAGAVDFLG